MVRSIREILLICVLTIHTQHILTIYSTYTYVNTHSHTQQLCEMLAMFISLIVQVSLLTEPHRF